MLITHGNGTYFSMSSCRLADLEDLPLCITIASRMLKLLKTGALAWTLTDAGFVLTTPSRREHTPQHLESIWANQRTEMNADQNRIVLTRIFFYSEEYRGGRSPPRSGGGGSSGGGGGRRFR
jgi:hypothetical protein